MANRQFENVQLSLEKKKVDLYLKVSFGASGAPTIVRGKGIATIVRNSAGRYTITLGKPATASDSAVADNYPTLLGVRHNFLNATAPASPGMYVVSDSVASGSLVIQFNAAGTATDPASGEVAMVQLSLSNSAL